MQRSCPSWRELELSRGDLAAPLGDLGAILGTQDAANLPGWQQAGGGHQEQCGPPLRRLSQSSTLQGLKLTKYNEGSSREVYNTPSAALGAADLGRAAREDRRPPSRDLRCAGCSFQECMKAADDECLICCSGSSRVDIVIACRRWYQLPSEKVCSLDM